MSLALLLIAAAIFVFRHFIAVTLYAPGGKVSLEMTLLLQDVLGVYAFTLPFTAIGVVLTKQYFSLHRIERYVSIMLVVNVVSCIVYYFAIGRWNEMGFCYSALFLEAFMALSLWIGIRSLKIGNRL
jgi:peptidoglycan biosynthesis protein MviN/MurJ (putative lipid II flippase)